MQLTCMCDIIVLPQISGSVLIMSKAFIAHLQCMDYLFCGCFKAKQTQVSWFLFTFKICATFLQFNFLISCPLNFTHATL